jgi:hypothetical protein
MTKLALPFFAPDVSAFAKALSASLAARGETKMGAPSHLELLNLIVKAVGARNYQAWRASVESAAKNATELARNRVETAPQVSPEKSFPPIVEKALRVFDEQARMTRWPVDRKVQRLCTWFMWSRFEKRRAYHEREVNALLSPWTTFQAHVTMRRELVNDALVTRDIEGSNYQRVDIVPPEEVRMFLKAISARVKA